MRLLTAILVLTLTACAASLSGCAQTPQGKSVERAQYADLGSTAAAIAQGASEANPLGVSLLVIKPMIGKVVDGRDIHCTTMKNTVQLINGVTYAAVANNLAIAASLVNPLAWGLVGGLAYAAWYPDAIDCASPDDVQAMMLAFVDAYNQQDAEALGLCFAEDAITPFAHHRPHIQWVYSEMFRLHEHYILEVDGPYLHQGGHAAWLRFDTGWVQWQFEADNGFITVSYL